MNLEYKLTNTEKKFSKYRKKLIEELTNARAYLNLSQHLVKYWSDNPDELSQAKHFFAFTTKAHLDCAILTLSRILIKSRDSLSIWKFLNFVESNRPVFFTDAFYQRVKHKPNYIEYWVKHHVPITSEEIQQLKKRIEELEELIRRIKGWRDKVIAHLDRTFYLREKRVSQEYPLRTEELQKIIETTLEILNRVSIAYDGKEYNIRIGDEWDIRAVVASIQLYRTEQERGNVKLL